MTAGVCIRVRSRKHSLCHGISGLVAVLASAIALASCLGPGELRPDPRETVRTQVAHIVDSDTGRPVQGAVVLMAFYLWPERDPSLTVFNQENPDGLKGWFLKTGRPVR
jgi:hypothetical protein